MTMTTDHDEFAPKYHDDDNDTAAAAADGGDGDGDGGAVVEDAHIAAAETKKFGMQETLVYFIFLLQGVGVLLPWNAFISAPDYFMTLYDKVDNIIIIFGITYSLPNLIGLLFMTWFGSKIPVMFKSQPSYMVALAVMILVPVLGFIGLPYPLDLVITLISIVCVAFATAALQGTIFGFAGIFPPKMIQAVMMGNGVAGIITSMIRVITKVTIEKKSDSGEDAPFSAKQNSASIYFFVGAFIIFMCIITFFILMRTPYVRYYMQKAASASGNNSSSGALDERNGAINGVEDDEEEGVTINHGEVIPLTSAGGSATSPSAIYGSADGEEQPVSFDQLRGVQDDGESSLLLGHDGSMSNAGSNKKPSVLTIFKKTWYMCIMQTLVFWVTITAFPGLAMDIKSSLGKDMCEWLPIIMGCIYNVFDFLGRSAPRFLVFLNRKTISIPIVARAILIIILAIAINPRPEIFSAFDIVPMATVALLALTNGYLSTMLFMLNPALVEPHEMETAGTMLTFFLLLGINLGSNTSLVLDLMLLPTAPNPCKA